MAEEQKSTELQQDNDNIQNSVTPTKEEDDSPMEKSTQGSIDTLKKNGDVEPPEEKGDGDNDGVEPKEEAQPAEEKNDARKPQNNVEPESKNSLNLKEGKGNKITHEDIIKKLNGQKCALDCDRCCNTIKYLFLIVLCLGGISVLTLVLLDVWEVQLNVYSSVLIYGLILLLVMTTVVLSYMLTVSNRRYSAAIFRLDLLITRIGFMENNSKLLADVDRELQLIARLLESSNERYNNK